jgi:hypothetical protein
MAAIAMSNVFDDTAVLLAGTPGAQQIQAEEEKIEAAFIWQFFQFIEFPAQTLQEPFIVGFIGTSRVEIFLAEIIRQKRLQDGRAVEVRHLNNLDEIIRCNAIFVAPSENARLTQILTKTRGRGILSIGHDDDFLLRGGMMNFYIENTRVRFEYSTEEIASSKLRFSSQLLRHGRQYSKTAKE